MTSEEAKTPANPATVVVEEDDGDDDDGYVGERMVDVGIEPIRTSAIEAELKTIFEANNIPYVRNPALINDIGQRIVDELELMIRMINPESTYRPEWYEEAEDQTVLAAIVGRDDLVGAYRDGLVETYDNVSEDIADAIVDFIVGVVSDHESTADEYYTAAENAE